MASADPPNNAPGNPFRGPEAGDPLTSKEELILLALPRAAQTSPDTTAFRLPLGPDPTRGWVDVTFLEARSIVSRLATTWKSRLENIIEDEAKNGSGVGPGTTICIFVQPAAHGIFHHLAFGSLGCTVQYISLSLGNNQICSYLRESNCTAILHSGITTAWVTSMKDCFDGELIALPEEEFSHQLAFREKAGYAMPAPPWPVPRRPTPALILHSSGTTGVAKLIRFSLFWYSLFLPTDDVKVISAAYFSGTAHSSPKPPQIYPQLIFSPPFWQSYHSSLLIHLITATPVAFCHFQDAINLPSKQLIPWARALDVGSIICSPRFLREIPIEEFETQAQFLGSLNSITVSGGPVDSSMSTLFEKYRLPITNLYSTSELGGGLSAKLPPYTHLRPGLRGPPLVFAISEPDLDGSRQVQLWHALSTSTHLAHFHACGDVTISSKLEPFPGEGSHKGELAFNTNDIFLEVKDKESGVAYIFLGRGDDMIRITGYADMNASQFETEFISTIDTRWKQGQGQGQGRKWMLDAVQLFGNTLPYTALVVQLCSSSRERVKLGQEELQELYEAVGRVNETLALGHLSVDARKRMLVVTSEGEAYGPNSASVQGLRLEVTHKHSLQRWRNVQTFKGWLEGLEGSGELGKPE
ncbi:unnamed protein product [Rhizoctonia solani]|uniref:AMP-dependent synthetase/ligase domain-containing protein n=1 Tax=Rhizoctonia solani TaxID=456999 RepID=A0A8H3HYL3_9AGAM|nr:unnamed protein product [Rhizoctonia solani]